MAEAALPRDRVAGPRRRSGPRTGLGWVLIAASIVLSVLVGVELINVFFYDPFGEPRFLWSFQNSLAGIQIAWLSILMFGSLLVLLALGLPLAFVTGSLGVLFIYLVGDQFMLNIIPTRIFPLMTNYQLSAIPLFIFMASMLERAGLIDEMFDVIYKWLGGVAGGLASATILASTILAAMVGVLEIVMGLARLGFLANLISRPVIAGFSTAAAVIIGAGQLGNLLGVELGRSEYVHQLVVDAVAHLGQADPLSLGLGLGSLVVVLLFQRWKPLFPSELAVLVAGTVLAAGLSVFCVLMAMHTLYGMVDEEDRIHGIVHLHDLMRAGAV